MNWKRFMDVEQLKFNNEDELLDELYKQMFIVAYAKTYNKDDALDIVQESWVKILIKLDTLRDPQKLIQWAKVIAANTAVNMLKSKGKDWLPLIDEGMGIGDLGADIHLADKETRNAVNKGLSMLENDERQILFCKFFYAWKDKQIAEVMELPVGTVKAKIHRAKAKLRRYLANDM